MTVATVTVRRGFPMEMAGKLWTWLHSPAEPNFDDFNRVSLSEFARTLEHRLSREHTWAIIEDDAVVGFAAFQLQSPMCGQFHGIVLKPSARGRGVGRHAVEAIVDELREAGVSKFVAAIFADNEPVRRMLAGAGFEEQGYFPRMTQRDGKPLDVRWMCWTEEVR